MNVQYDFLPEIDLKARDRATLEFRAAAELELRARRAANPFAGYARPLELRGNVKAAHPNTDRELTLVGPAGTSKTVGNLQKVHKCCLKYAGARWLFLRKFRADLTESVMETYENVVLPPGSPIMAGQRRDNRRSYRYPNGSMIVCGGMDMATRLFSTRYDGIFCNELIEFDSGDFETLLRCLRSFVMPFRQILSDTNPGPPTHWIKQRAESGKMTLLETWHRDNPYYWDLATNDYTPEGREYIQNTLAPGLTGVRRDRLLLGKWASAEGVVYEDWSEDIHHIKTEVAPFKLYASARRLWSVDFGYWPDPFVWQEWLIDGEGRMYLIREIYQTKRRVEELCKDIITLTAGSPKPTDIVADHDGNGRATLEHFFGMSVTPAYKKITDGIQAVMGRLQTQGDGLPRLMIVRGATWKRDQALKKLGKPTTTADEFLGYIWHPKHKKDLPLDRDNHGMDALRYAVAHEEGLRDASGGGAAETNVYRDVYNDDPDDDEREFAGADWN